MKTWKSSFFKRALILLGVLLLTSESFAATEPIPNGGLEVAYRQLTDGKLSESVHNVVLSCSNGECEITTLTLNRCLDFSDGRSFYPAIEKSSISEGNLTVNVLGKGIIEVVEEKILSATTFKYRFSYTTKTNPSLSKAIGSPVDLWFNELTGFSGAAIKQSDILNKVISWELVPLKGKSVVIKPACNMNLKGAPK